MRVTLATGLGCGRTSWGISQNPAIAARNRACASIEPNALRVGVETLYWVQESLNVNAPGGKAGCGTTRRRTSRMGSESATSHGCTAFAGPVGIARLSRVTQSPVITEWTVSVETPLGRNRNSYPSLYIGSNHVSVTRASG